MFLKNISNIRKIDFERAYLWDIVFDDSEIPSPFDKWFPAVDVEEPFAVLNTFTFEAGGTNIQVPQNTNNLELKITFYDESQHILLYWLKNWMDSISGVDFVFPLENCVKRLMIARLNLKREFISNQTHSYWVYPKGEITYHGSSTSELNNYIVNFVVAGKNQ